MTFLTSVGFNHHDSSANRLWYVTPAERWFDALPIGNGRLGGMVFNAQRSDTILLSESTAWSGGPATSDVNPGALAHLAEIRAALFAGHYDNAHRLTEEHLLGTPTSFGTNLPLPSVIIEFESSDAEGSCTRELDISEAIATSHVVNGNQEYRTETFASRPDRVIVYRVEPKDGGQLSARVAVTEAVFPLHATMVENGLKLSGRAVETLHSNGIDGVPITIRVQLVADSGVVNTRDGEITVSASEGFTVLVAVGSGWEGEDSELMAEQAIENAAVQSHEQLRARHVSDYHELYSRVKLNLGTSSVDQRKLPTDERRRLLATGMGDPELISLYFQYGRYLTIAGSRHDSPLPLALQGLWNDGLASSAPWTNDYHLDMNTQQNYWAAEVTAIGECQEPLLRLVERLSVSGRDTARDMYGARGWVAHTVTNAWGYSAPGWGMGWGMAVTAGAWIALQHWDHWDYSRDAEFLRNRAYPVLKEAAKFFLDYLVVHPRSGWLVTGPSDSPENWFVSESGQEVAVSMGASGDRVFVESIFRIVVEAAEILGVDAALVTEIQAARELLPPFQIGKFGQLQEWLEDYDEAAPAHRHTSHLMALFPERQITPRDHPELARACEVTIERREAAPGWEQTEWVEANLIAYYARLLRGDIALQHVKNLILDASESNLMTFSAGGVAGAAQNIYSFDGNAGGTAGIAEMLLQSDGAEIELLPALPTGWRQGSVTGLRARNGVRVDIHWEDGALARAELVADHDVEVSMRYGDRRVSVSLRAGECHLSVGGELS
jgi:alpha-L-fucosidase 2